MPRPKSSKKLKNKLKNKLALQTIDLNNLSQATRQALQVLEEAREQEVETVMAAKLQKLLLHSKGLRKLYLEEQQLSKAALTIPSREQRRLTTTLPDQRKRLIKTLRLKAAKLASAYLSVVHRKYNQQREQILLQEAKAQQQQKQAPQIYARQLFQNLNQLPNI
jgi:hypothetical protein